jgi:3',5'-cyclic AMP phosphodiesterase CpdA
MRVLHLSDVHVDIPLSAMPWREMWNKRFLGAGNLELRRRSHFAQAREKLDALAQLARDERVDLVICTGDYTALGTELEIAAARGAISRLTEMPLGFVTVPGNHDLYLPRSVVDGRFERHFGDLMRSDLPDACVDGVWPIVRLCGEKVAVIAVNSARPNPQPWRSSGRIPDAQLDALTRLLDDPRLRDRFIFVITHYAPRRADGSPDRWSHGLENADAFLAACGGIGRGAVLHGHLHHRFHLKLAELRAHIFGAGSATSARHEGFWVFDVGEGATRATPGSFESGRYVLDNAAALTF